MQAPNFGGRADRGDSSYRPVAQIELASVPSGLTIVHKDDREIPDSLRLMGPVRAVGCLLGGGRLSWLSFPEQALAGDRT